MTDRFDVTKYTKPDRLRQNITTEISAGIIQGSSPGVKELYFPCAVLVLLDYFCYTSPLLQ
jgi:hypothetical protein